MKSHRRKRYPEAAQVAALTALQAGQTLRQVSQVTQIPEGTLSVWNSARNGNVSARSMQMSDHTLALIRGKSAELADKLEDLAHRAVGLITDEELTDASPYHKTLIAAIATEKMQLLRDAGAANLGASDAKQWLLDQIRGTAQDVPAIPALEEGEGEGPDSQG